MYLESIVKKLFLGGTAVVAAATSLMAAQSFALTSAEGSNAASGVTATTTFSLTVNEVLAVSASSATINIATADISKVNTGTLSATVQSNTPYEIKLSAATPALKSGSDSIAAGSTNVKANTTVSSWGIKKKGGTTFTDNSTNATAYTALTTSEVTFYDSNTTKASGTNGVTTNFEVGVSVTKAQPVGTYSTSVTVTAVKS